MTDLLIVLVSVLPGVYVWRRVAWLIYADDVNTAYPKHRPGEIDGEALGLAVFMGFLVALVWPGALLWLAVRNVFHANSDVVMAMFTSQPRAERKAGRIKRLEQEAEERDRKIADLERRLEVGS